MRLLGVFFFVGFLTIGLNSITSTTWSSTDLTSTPSLSSSGPTPTVTASTDDGSSATGQGDATPTGPTTTKGSTPTAPNGPTAPSTTAGPSQSPGPTDAPGPSTPPGPTDAPGSPTTPGPSDAPGPSTTPGPTKASTTEAPSTATTPIPVTVQKAQMTMTCENGRCKYLLKVPRLSKAFIDQQNGQLATDESLFATEESKYKGLQSNSDITDIQKKFNEISAIVQNITDSLNAIQTALKTIPSNSLYTNSSASRIQSYVTLIGKDTDNCLYQACLLPPPTTTTTTTTTMPTTTPDPCANVTCNYQATCQNVGGKAQCSTCNGNLDNTQMCVTSKCTAPGESKVQTTDGSFIYYNFVSPGYDISTNTSSSDYGSNLTCEWQLQSTTSYFSVPPSSDPPFEKMDSTAKIVLKSGSFTYTITSVTSASKVNGALKMCPSPTVRFTFTTGNVNPAKDGTWYFAIKLSNADP